jgi:hypothetical protein
MRVAVLADIHGNLPDIAANVRQPESDAAALEAFTDTVRRQQAD